MALPDYKADPEWQRARRRFFATVGEHLSKPQVEQYKRWFVASYLAGEGAELPDRLSLGLVPPERIHRLCNDMAEYSPEARGLVLTWRATSPAARTSWLIERGREFAVLRSPPLVTLVRRHLLAIGAHRMGLDTWMVLTTDDDEQPVELRVVDLGALMRVACV